MFTRQRLKDKGEVTPQALQAGEPTPRPSSHPCTVGWAVRQRLGVLALPLDGCVAFGDLFHISEPQPSDLQHGLDRVNSDEQVSCPLKACLPDR